MTYKSFFISGTLFFALSPILVIGMDPTTSGRIIDTFKREQYTILFENQSFDQSGANEIFEKEYILYGIEWLKKRLDEATEAYQAKKDETTQRKLSLEDTLYTIEKSIADTVSNIAKTEKSMQEKNQRIEEYQDLSIDLSIRIKKNRGTILSYLANIYSEGNLIYDDTNQIDIFQSLIMTDASVDDLSRDITYKALVSILGQKFIEEYRTLIKDYALMKIRIREEIALLDTDKSLFERQKSNLLSQREYREQLIEATKWQEELYTQYIEAQIATQKQLEVSWQEVADSYTVSLENLLDKNGCNAEKKTGEDIEKCGNILAFYRNERALKRISISSGTLNVFEWPISKSETISAFFKDPSYYRVVWSQHDAIDIVASQWSEVHAAMDGYVQYILPPVPWGYSYMAIKHPDGLVTVYGHLSEVLVYPYQFIKKWDIIALSGWAPGTPGAGPMTSGAHLHFEVWKNRTPVDPLRYLDISSLDYENLPARYQDKYISDIVERYWSGTDTSGYERTFIIRGETEIDRQKYLLSTYATPDFQNYDLWIDTAVDARIDPSFLLCVGLAETTLGNYLKTPYNIWNVGNTDSGDVTTFFSAKEGMEWMASTFNNRYLSQYEHVSELSRWGNIDGTIYASSNANWHNTIIRCISSLKGRFVEDDYEFRISEE